MLSKVRNAVKNCQKCIKHEFNSSKEPLHPIIVTAPLYLVHIDFTSIKVSGDDDLHTTPTIVPVLPITSLGTKLHLLLKTKKPAPSQRSSMRITSVSLDHQQGYTVIKEPTLPAWSSLCYAPFWEFRSHKLLHTAPRGNGKVERIHQTLIRMIGKVPEQKKIKTIRTKLTHQHIYQKYYKLIMVPNLLSLATVLTTSCLVKDKDSP